LSEKLEALGKPMVIDGYTILPVKVRVLSRANSSTILEFTLYEGRNRQIRKMCESQDLKISRLSRVAIGDLTLGALECGKWRFLTEEEVSYLKNS
jgi:pseudouridine synthase